MTLAHSKVLKLCSSQELLYLYLRLLIIVLVGVAAYSNTFGMPFIFDDAANIINNAVVKEFNIAGFKAAFQDRRAFGILTFQINYFLFGDNVFGYHLTNLFIHIAAALLIYAMVSLILRTPYFDKSLSPCTSILPVPFFTALFFVVHPIQTQAVTYIVQRFASLATLLFVAAIVCYLKARISQQRPQRSLWAESVWFAGCIAAIILAISTKEIAYTCPLAIILVELLFFELNRRKIFKLFLVTLAAIMLLLIRISSGNISLDTIISRLDDITRIQTISSRSDYLFTQFRVIVTYLRLLLMPVNQSLDYDYTLSHSFFEWKVLVSFLLLLAIFSFSLWLITVSRGGKPYLRLSAFGILWFFLTLSVESSILPIIDIIFEHRLYLPSVGFFLATSSLGLLFSWGRGSLLVRQRFVQGLLFIALVLAGSTWKRNLVWTNEVTLWQDVVAKKPNSARAWNNLGGAFIKQREGIKALQALIRSIELNPSKADAFNNVGIAIDLMGSYNDRFYRTTEMFNDPRAIEGKTVSRWLGDVNNNLGLAYEITGDLPKAANSYRSAIGHYPALGVAYFNLGLVSAAMSDYAKYSEQLQILLMIDPVLAERLQLRASVRGGGR